MSDLHDADRQRGGYDFRGECVGSRGVDEGSSGFISDDGDGLSEGADGDSCIGSEGGGIELRIFSFFSRIDETEIGWGFRTGLC